MPRKNKRIRKTVARIDEIIKEYKLENPPVKRDYRTYEQQLAQRARKCFMSLEPLVEEAISTTKIVVGEKRGALPKTSLKQKVLLLLLKQFCQKSNRCMEWMLVLFNWLTNIDVSYKTIERLYSDLSTQVVIHNMYTLLLQKKNIINAKCSGDGTGYTISITEHYATIAQKYKEKAKSNEKIKTKRLVYSFCLLDLKSRLYIGCGVSFKSEKEAFENALQMAKETGITVNDIRLDRYYSSEALHNLAQQYLGKAKIYLIPKKNIVHIGMGEFSKTINDFVDNTKSYLKEYFQRNQSESCFGEDKKRTGWKVAQKIEQRVETAIFTNMLWHNMFWVGANV